MPTVFTENGYRFFFFSGDRKEPVHVHIQKGNALAKFWVTPVVFARANGFARAELNDIQKILEARELEIVRCWNEFFGS